MIKTIDVNIHNHEYPYDTALIRACDIGNLFCSFVYYFDIDFNVISMLGDEKMVVLLLQNGADVNISDTNGHTPLEAAIYSGKFCYLQCGFHIATVLFTFLRFSKFWFKFTLFMPIDNVEIVKHLFEHGASANGYDYKCVQPPLIKAVRHGNLIWAIVGKTKSSNRQHSNSLMISLTLKSTCLFRKVNGWFYDLLFFF